MHWLLDVADAPSSVLTALSSPFNSLDTGTIPSGHRVWPVLSLASRRSPGGAVEDDGERQALAGRDY